MGFFFPVLVFCGIVEQSGLERGWGELKISVMEPLKFALVLQHSCNVYRAATLFICVVRGHFVSILVATDISLTISTGTM